MKKSSYFLFDINLSKLVFKFSPEVHIFVPIEVCFFCDFFHNIFTIIKLGNFKYSRQKYYIISIYKIIILKRIINKKINFLVCNINLQKKLRRIAKIIKKYCQKSRVICLLRSWILRPCPILP